MTREEAAKLIVGVLEKWSFNEETDEELLYCGAGAQHMFAEKIAEALYKEGVLR